jgi:beta-glucosidase
MVLLKNDGVLPLRRDLTSIAVIGPSADSVRHLQGDYHYPAHLEMMFGAIREDDLSPRPPGEVNLAQHFPLTVTVLEGIRSRVAETCTVHFARGCGITGESTQGFAAAVDAARRAEVAVVVVGEKSGLVEGCTSGESVDRADLALAGVQQQLVEAIVATGTPVVVVLINGRPLALPWIAEHVPAIVEAWVPGEEGGSAVAAVLFGDHNPAGRLPVCLPRSVGQVPVYYGHKPSGGRSQWKGDYADLSSTPLFAFGHGLSYTNFEYSDLVVAPEQVAANGVVEVRCRVENTGAREGEEVVQLYLHDVHASVTRAVQQLAGFARVRLRAGEACRVAFEVPVELLAFHDLGMELVVEPGAIEVMVGASSADVRLRGHFDIVGPRRPVGRRRAFSSRARFS